MTDLLDRVRTTPVRSRLQGQVPLAVLMGGLSFRAASGAPVTPEPRMTLRPGAPVSMLVSGRHSGG